jgi:hypothetical protein
MRLSQNGKRSDAWIDLPGTLTEHRRRTDSTLPIASSSWNSVSPMISWADRPGKRVARRVNGQRVKDRGESKCRAVIARIGDNVLHSKGALTSAWCGMARVYAESPRQEASKHEIRAS